MIGCYGSKSPDFKEAKAAFGPSFHWLYIGQTSLQDKVWIIVSRDEEEDRESTTIQPFCEGWWDGVFNAYQIAMLHTIQQGHLEHGIYINTEQPNSGKFC